MTFVSEGCSEVLVSSGALPVLLDLVAKTNRSTASLHVVKTITKILLNVTKVWWDHCQEVGRAGRACNLLFKILCTKNNSHEPQWLAVSCSVIASLSLVKL